MSYEILDDKTIKLSKKVKSKKITGTRLGSILGFNVWNTPFKTWCEMTKVYKEPFEDTIYTIAGKVIEPKIIKYLKTKLYAGEVVDGEEYFGKHLFNMRFDYYPQEPIFGGMWDALLLSKKTKKPVGVIEIKTSKRAEDWETDIPLYYKAQAMLYAHLLGVKTIYFAVAFLNDEDYEDPSKFEATDETVKIISFRLDEDKIKAYMDLATSWYNDHIINGISPVWDDKKDNDILKELRTNIVETPPVELEELLKIVDDLKPQIEELEDKQKVLKKTQETIKEYLLLQFGKTDTKVTVDSKKYTIEVSKSSKTDFKFNMEQFQAENIELYNKYLQEETKETIRQTIKKRKGA